MRISEEPVVRGFTQGLAGRVAALAISNPSRRFGIQAQPTIPFARMRAKRIRRSCGPASRGRQERATDSPTRAGLQRAHLAFRNEAVGGGVVAAHLE